MPEPAASHDKTIARLEKLLRLASPASRAPEAERASAALEIVRLIVDHDLKISHRAEKNKNSPSKTWKSSIAARNAECYRCGGAIRIGEEIFAKSATFSFVYSHLHCTD